MVSHLLQEKALLHAQRFSKVRRKVLLLPLFKTFGRLEALLLPAAKTFHPRRLLLDAQAEGDRRLKGSTCYSYSLLISFFYTKGTVPFVLRYALYFGAGVRQLSRLTGVSFGVVQKLTK